MKKEKIVRVNKIGICIVTSMFLAVVLLAGTYGQSFLSTGTTNTQYSQPTFQEYYSKQGVSYSEFWPILGDPSKCEARSDFIVSIRPGGCQPMVVRSDLLEEQNVPVFCKMDAIKLNPLIDVASIKSVGFKGNYPPEVAGVSFHPSQAALRIYNPVLDSPLMNDVGYVVVVLKKQEAEKLMKDNIEVKLTAVLKYDMQNVIGAGKTSFYLQVMDDAEWQDSHKENSFWRGRGYIRADWVDKDTAEISVYKDANSLIRSVTLDKGKTSDLIYMPGFYCQGGIRINLRDTKSGADKAKIRVGEDEYWLVEGEKFLDDNCQVKEIKSSEGGAGEVTLSCRGKPSTMNLKVGVMNKVVLEKINGNKEQKIVEVGSKIPDLENIFVAYAGLGKPVPAVEEKLFIIWAKEVPANYLENGKITQAVLDQIAGVVANNKKDNVVDKDKIIAEVKKLLNIKPEFGVAIIFAETDVLSEGHISYKLIGKPELEDEICGGNVNSDCEKYFENANKTAHELVESYKGEKNNAGEYYGAIALWDLAELAGNAKIGKQKTQKQVLTELKDKYPESVYADNARTELERLDYYNYENAVGSLAIGTQTYYIKLIEARKPDVNDASAEFRIDGTLQGKKYVIGDYVVEPGTNGEYFRLIDLDEDYVVVDYKIKDATKEANLVETKGKQFKKGDKLNVNGELITLDKINLKRQAVVSLISEFPSGTSEANFTVKIGIEKRAIQLSPEKTREMINNLNKSIEKFQKIVDRLGSVVKGLKGACFATTAVLIVKNFFQNLGGRSLARKEAMDKHWKSKCQEEVADKTSSNLDECYGKHASEIESSVDELQKSMNDRNNEISKIVADNTKSTGILGGSQTDMNKSTWEYAEKFKSWKSTSNVEVTINGQKKMLSQLSDAEINQMVADGDLTMSQMRDIMMYGSLKENVNADLKNKALGIELSPVFQTAENAKAKSDFMPLLSSKVPGAYINDLKPIGKDDYVRSATLTGNEITIADNNKVPAGKYIFVHVPQQIGVGKTPDNSLDPYKGRVLLVPVKGEGALDRDDSRKSYILDASGKTIVTGGEVSKENISKIMSSAEIGRFVEISKSQCENKYLNAKVKYYETEPYKGMPSVVPVDVAKGWYAGTRQTIPAFGGLTSFQASGAVSSLYLCNVGKNGLEEWNSPAKDDDPCIQINYNTGQPLSELGACFTSDEAKKIALQAKSLVEDAASQYGKPKIKLKSGEFNAERAVQTPGVECQDFMSPTDCNILFNVCDPVLCPASRCNFGGTHQVDDVIQSGIIGSIVLCLPNFGVPPKGVLVPVCLSGIQAGLDAYVSILKSHRDCLQENLASGKTIGICDEIYSIYMCEFFWRQAAPILDVALPKLIEYMYTGGKTQGGGEYLTVQNSWDNMKKSTTFMTDYYGVNAFKAFQARSTADVGTEVCKGFIGTSIPTKIDTLLEPESPVQFYARFDETLYTEATVPATSQYKVYYHIFAGRETGHYYQVYLKSPPETAYYSSQPRVSVDSGYVGIGQTIDQAKDFTAPAGYKELCVVIDAKEECGFKQVTTSFAVDYLKDEYVAQQAGEQITSEKDCVSGTPSMWALPSAGAEAAAMPAVYKSGLIRVCSSEDPGNATNPGRWKNVGYCSDDKKIKCWLDTESAKNAIQDTGLENQALSNAEAIVKQGAIDRGLLFNEDQTNSKLTAVKKAYKTFEGNPSADDTNLILSLEEIKDKGFFNSQKAEAIFLLFRVYKLKVENLAGISEAVIVSVPATTTTAVPAAGAGTTPAAATPATTIEIKGTPKFYILGSNREKKYVNQMDYEQKGAGLEIDSNCPDLICQVFSQETGSFLFFKNVNWWAEDVSQSDEIPCSEVGGKLDSLMSGKYYVNVKCQQNDKIKGQSGILTIVPSAEPKATDTTK